MVIEPYETYCFHSASAHILMQLDWYVFNVIVYAIISFYYSQSSFDIHAHSSLTLLFSFPFYWDITDAQHCRSLRLAYIMEWLSTHLI